MLGWEPHFCVLLQDEQTLTAYRSEEMAVSTQPTHWSYTTARLTPGRGSWCITARLALVWWYLFGVFIFSLTWLTYVRYMMMR